MRQEKGLQTVVISVLAVAILVMSVGFAAYSQTLNIDGNVTFSKAKWSVRFDSNSFQEGGTVTSTAHNITDTTATYTVKLNQPGDYYTFTVNVINDGTLDALLNSINITTPANKPYIKHSVSYSAYNSGTAIETSATNISGVTLAGQTGSTAPSHTVVVRVDYLLPANASDLPTDADDTVTLSVSLGYTSVAQ